MDDIFVPVQREVVALRGDIGLRHGEALGGAVGECGGILSIFTIPLSPFFQNLGQVVFRVFPGVERGGGNGAEFFVGQERRAFVIEAPAIGFEIVEEDVIGAAGVGFCEDEDGGGDARVGLEDAAGQGDHGIEFLLLDEHLAQGLVGI